LGSTFLGSFYLSRIKSRPSYVQY